MKILHQITKYAVAASVGLVIDFMIVFVLSEIFDLYYLLSVCAGFIVGLIVTFFLSNRLAFGDPGEQKRRVFIYFGLIGIGGLVILNISVFVLTEHAGLNYLLSKAVSTLVVFLFNFFARRSLYEA